MLSVPAHKNRGHERKTPTHFRLARQVHSENEQPTLQDRSTIALMGNVLRAADMSCAWSFSMQLFGQNRLPLTDTVWEIRSLAVRGTTSIGIMQRVACSVWSVRCKERIAERKTPVLQPSIPRAPRNMIPISGSRLRRTGRSDSDRT